MKYYTILVDAGFADAISRLYLIYNLISIKLPNLIFIITRESYYKNWHSPKTDFYKLFGLDRYFLDRNLTKKKINIDDLLKINNFMDIISNDFELLEINSLQSWTIGGFYINNKIPYIIKLKQFTEFTPTYNYNFFWTTNKKKCIYHVRCDDLLLTKKNYTKFKNKLEYYDSVLNNIDDKNKYEIILFSDGLPLKEKLYNRFENIDIEKEIVNIYDNTTIFEEFTGNKFIGKDENLTIKFINAIYYADIIIYNFSSFSKRILEIIGRNNCILKNIE